MKRFWHFIHITGSNCQRALEITTTFLERSKPLHVAFHHETNRLPPSAVTRLLDGVYTTLVKNRERIAKFFLCGLFHRTAWMLLQEGLPNTVEIGLYPNGPTQLYGNSLPSQNAVRNRVEGPSLNVKKLSLLNRCCESNSYPNITHLSLRHRQFSPNNDEWIIRFISSLSNTLQVLSLQNAGLYEFPPESGKEIHLPHLRKFLATSEEDEDDMKRSLGFLHHLSLPASVSILWGSRSERDLMVRFPPTEHLKLVQSIVISLEQPDYLDCACLIEGGTLFTSPANFSRLRYLCIQFFKVTSISFPSSWMKCLGNWLMRILNEWNNCLQGKYYPFIYNALSELHVYTGESDDFVLEEKMRTKISRELVENDLLPLKLSSSDHSMQFHHDTLEKSVTLYFHAGELPTYHVEQYW